MTDSKASHQFLNREVGQIEFNRRVLAQAENADTPLFERLKFLCIVSSNLDEFFEIRVAGLHAEIEAGTPAAGDDAARVSRHGVTCVRSGGRPCRGDRSPRRVRPPWRTKPGR